MSNAQRLGAGRDYVGPGFARSRQNGATTDSNVLRLFQNALEYPVIR
jgi:hypothetical protein